MCISIYVSQLCASACVNTSAGVHIVLSSECVYMY